MPIRNKIQQAEYIEEMPGTWHSYTLQRAYDTEVIVNTPLENIIFSNMDNYVTINGVIYNGFSKADVYKIKGVSLE